jgi:UDP-N-acetylglucosamine acyltransferase
MANGATLGGYAQVFDRAFLSGSCLVHQFCRVGTQALMQGGAAISKDLPPFTMALGVNEICGLNTIGLRRAGVTSAERLELRHLYRALFRDGVNLREAVAAAQAKYKSGPARLLLGFVAESKRGVCADCGAMKIGKAD